MLLIMWNNPTEIKKTPSLKRHHMFYLSHPLVAARVHYNLGIPDPCECTRLHINCFQLTTNGYMAHIPVICPKT